MKEAIYGYPLYLNMQNESHEELVCEYFGGKDKILKEYPCLYANLLSAQEAPGLEATYTGYCDGAVITHFMQNQEHKLMVIGNVNLTKRPYKLFVSITIMKADKIIKQKNQMYTDRATVVLECLSDAIPDVQSEDNYVAYLHVSWQPYGEAGLRSMIAQSTEWNIQKPLLIGSAISKTSITHPTLAPHTEYDNTTDLVPPDQKIIVAYNRQAAQGGVVDYKYSSIRSAEGLQMVFLDVSFSVYLKEGFKYKYLMQNSALLLGNGLGDIYHNRMEKIVPIKSEKENKITFTFNYDWNNTIPQSVYAGNRTYGFYAQVKFVVENSKQNIEVEAIASSLSDAKATNLVKTGQLYLFWGCLAENTMIRMADGSERAIQTIRVGDQLENAKGEAVRVTDVIVGSNEIIYHICTENNRCISATLLHPFATDSGDMLLRDFQMDTKLKMKKDGKNSSELVTNCYPEEYTGKVYSLEVEGGSEKTIIANGFVTYANSEVNRIERSCVEPEIVMTDEELNEYNKLKYVLENRKIDGEV